MVTRGFVGGELWWICGGSEGGILRSVGFGQDFAGWVDGEGWRDRCVYMGV